MYTVYIEGHGYHNSFERETLEEAKALADRLADKYACASVDIVVYDQDGNEVYTIE